MPIFTQEGLYGMVGGRYHDLMAERIRKVVTQNLVDEHKRSPFGQHSDALQRILNYLGSFPMQGKLILEHDGHERWYVSRLVVEERVTRVDRVSGPYDEKSATHAVFVQRLKEILNIDVPIE